MSDDTSPRINKWLIGLIVLTLFLSLWVLWATKDYDYISTEREGYKEGAHFISLFEQSVRNCIEHYESGHTNSCEEEFGAIEKLAAFSDLDAQITVAHGTRGLLFIGAIQAISSLLGVSLLIWTVVQAYGILDEAKEATKLAGLATEAAHKTAEAAENAERAYVSMDFKIKWDEGANEFYVDVFIGNYGKSPATSVSWKYFPISDGEKVGDPDRYFSDEMQVLSATSERTKLDTLGPFKVVRFMRAEGFQYRGEWEFTDTVTNRKLIGHADVSERCRVERADRDRFNHTIEVTNEQIDRGAISGVPDETISDQISRIKRLGLVITNYEVKLADNQS